MPRRDTLSLLIGFTLLFTMLQANAQNAAAPASSTPDVSRDDLPPSTIYAETMAPLEKTRSDIANWSEIELNALRSTTATAKAECLRIEQSPHEGEEALALARLCALGMDWDGTYSAARWYTRKTAPAGEAPHLAMGFALLLQAELNLQATARGLDDLAEMHDRLPLTADTDSIYAYAIASMEIMQPDRGLKVALLRQPDLLKVVAGDNSTAPSLAIGNAEEEAWHTLSQLHLARRSAEEQAAKAQLIQSIQQRVSVPSATDLYTAQRGRKRYEWLGKPFPSLHVVRNTYAATHQKSAPAKTELLVIEQADAADIAALGLGVDGLRTRLPNGVHATLVALQSHGASTAQPSLHAMYTNDDLLESFGFSNGPLFVIRDSHGAVLYLGSGTPAWLNPQMQAEQLIQISAPDDKAD